MLNEQPQVADNQLEKLIDDRIKLALNDVITRGELDQRLSEMEKRAGEHTVKLIAEAEGRLNETVNNLLNSFNNVAERLNEWKTSVGEQIHARSDQVSSLQGAVTTQGDAISLLKQKQTSVESALHALTVTIHGDPAVKADAPSLFESVHQIAEGVQRIDERLTQKIEDTWRSAEQSAQWIRQYQQDQAEAKRRREKRWSYVTRTLAWVNRTPVMIAILTLILVGLITVLWPQLGALLKIVLHTP